MNTKQVLSELKFKSLPFPTTDFCLVSLLKPLTVITLTMITRSDFHYTQKKRKSSEIRLIFQIILGGQIQAGTSQLNPSASQPRSLSPVSCQSGDDLAYANPTRKSLRSRRPMLDKQVNTLMSQ